MQDQIVTALGSLGPWGPVVGAALVLLLQRLKAKYPNLIPNTPVTPAPVPAPVPTPAPVPAPLPVPGTPERPVLTALLKVLLSVLAASAVKQGRPVEDVIAEKINEAEGS